MHRRVLDICLDLYVFTVAAENLLKGLNQGDTHAGDAFRVKPTPLLVQVLVPTLLGLPSLTKQIYG